MNAFVTVLVTMKEVAIKIPRVMMNNTEEVKRAFLVAYNLSYILDIMGNFQLSSTSDLSAQVFFIRSVDVREESSAGFLFGKIFNIINECQCGEKPVAQTHGSAVVVVSITDCRK